MENILCRFQPLKQLRNEIVAEEHLSNKTDLRPSRNRFPRHSAESNWQVPFCFSLRKRGQSSMHVHVCMYACMYIYIYIYI